MLPRFFENFALLSRCFSYIGGFAVIGFAIVLFLYGKTPGNFMGWIANVLSWSFICLLISLVIACMFCILKITNIAPNDVQQCQYWQQLGLQSSSAIATLALTYTLLGISMGIGSLSGQEMDVANINQIISNLTKQFSMAFMTSVIGLPVSAAFRTILVVAPLKPRLKQRSSKPLPLAPLSSTET